jgi:multicomponent K+:H+ antiporter subunit C
MELLIASAIGILVATGVYLLLRARTFPVILGLALLGYAVNLFLFASGGLRTGLSPVIAEGVEYPDPLPQALVLTAIVIGFGMAAFVVVLALRARAELGTDHVDGLVTAPPRVEGVTGAPGVGGAPGRPGADRRGRDGRRTDRADRPAGQGDER